ncbi:MAG TPA: glycine zipper 2TM domain-containing protein [Thermohalobaculum sp.]|nr:glycine zipper 2TM domain-containing protein [Thermohalobaculum sp.]
MRPGFRSAVMIPLAVTASLSLAACARQISPNVVEGGSTGQAMRTEIGWVESARVVQVQEQDRLQDNSAGLLIGGATGGLLGNQIGHGWGRVLATGAGALAGATVGAITEKELTNQTAIEYVFRNEIGQLYTIVQGPQPRLSPGQRVYLQSAASGRARLVPAG